MADVVSNEKGVDKDTIFDALEAAPATVDYFATSLPSR